MIKSVRFCSGWGGRANKQSGARAVGKHSRLPMQPSSCHGPHCTPSRTAQQAGRRRHRHRHRHVRGCAGVFDHMQGCARVFNHEQECA